MVLISEELVRKRSEHNEGMIGTLEELSLHQEDIEKIEHLNNWCKELKILYFQANQISKIENLNKLKKLEYLNLAINNIEKIENLERCESLNKLDLTLNFIGDLESVKSLKANIHLRDLYLTGNPCCDFKGYREYVIALLPQLQSLDVVQITRSERIKAQQNIEETERKIKKCQDNYRIFREDQKARLRCNDTSHLTNEEFWHTTSENSPETRMEMSKRQIKKDNIANVDVNKKTNRTLRLFNKDGRPLNVNQAKLNFTFSDANPEQFILDVAVYKYLDTNLIDIDLQPIYVKLTIKGKIFQIVFPEEVYVERSSALRSQTTGHLVLKLPRMNYKPPMKKEKECKENDSEKTPMDKKENEKNFKMTEYLEVTGQQDNMDFSNIVGSIKNKTDLYQDNPGIPMLEYGSY